MAKFHKEQQTRGVYAFQCPGCKRRHMVFTTNEGYQHGVWKWNGDVERPTITPSLLVNAPGRFHVSDIPTCHSFITDGMIHFLEDSTHELAGKTVELPNV